MRLKTHIRIVGLVAIGGLVVGLALLLRAELGLLREARDVVRSFEGLQALSELAHELQRERGLAQMSAGTTGAHVPAVAQYPRTDAAQRAALAAGAIGDDEIAPLRLQRRQWGNGGSDPMSVRAYYTAAIDRLLRRVAEQARDTADPALRKALLAQSELLRTKEALGALRALGTYGLAQGEARAELAARSREQLAVVDAQVDAGRRAGAVHHGERAAAPRQLARRREVVGVRVRVDDVAQRAARARGQREVEAVVRRVTQAGGPVQRVRHQAGAVVHRQRQLQHPAHGGSGGRRRHLAAHLLLPQDVGELGVEQVGHQQLVAEQQVGQRRLRLRRHPLGRHTGVDDPLHRRTGPRGQGGSHRVRPGPAARTAALTARRAIRAAGPRTASAAAQRSGRGCRPPAGARSERCRAAAVSRLRERSRAVLRSSTGDASPRSGAAFP